MSPTAHARRSRAGAAALAGIWLYTVALGAMAMWLLPPWAAWIDRHHRVAQ